MSDNLCVRVKYSYRRGAVPASRKWSLSASRETKTPERRASGFLNIADAGGDMVSVVMAVPCNERGEVDGDIQDEFQELADRKFLEARPDAELT